MTELKIGTRVTLVHCTIQYLYNDVMKKVKGGTTLAEHRLLYTSLCIEESERFMIVLIMASDG